MQTLIQEAPKQQVRFDKDDPCLKFVRFMEASENQRKEKGGVGAVPLKVIAKKFASNVIANCAVKGLIEFGNADHSWTGPIPGMVVDERDDTGKVISQHWEDRRKIHVGKLTSFHLLSRHGSKPIDEIIEENNNVDEKIQSFVRLTNEGLAATLAA